MMTESSKSSIKVETLYDKLNNLADEISEGIINLGDGSRENVQQELTDLREQAYKERSPEAVYNTLLFRKYASVANQIKDARAGGRDKATFVGELPSFVYQGDDEQDLVGHQSTQTNIFRIRAAAAIFALISFSVMSSAALVKEATFSPNSHFNDTCAYKGAFSGSFNFRAYQLVIAVGVLAWLHNSFYMLYYYLPVDINRQKYLPGGSWLLKLCFSTPGQVDGYTAKLALFVKTHGKFLEMLFDALFLCIAIIAFVVGQSRMDTATEFTVQGATQFYTLSSCYETYTHQTPRCLHAGENPVSRIRASLAMLFFATLFMLITFLGTLRAFRQDTSPGLFTGAFGLDATRHSSSGAAPYTSDSQHGLPPAPGGPAPAAPTGYGVVGTALSNSGSLNNSAHSGNGSTHGPMHASPAPTHTIYEEDYGHIGSKL